MMKILSGLINGSGTIMVLMHAEEKEEVDSQIEFLFICINK